jgi:hypothetical protein
MHSLTAVSHNAEISSPDPMLPAAKAKLLHLPEEGFAGNSHMLMMDRNNLKIADRIIGWLRDNVKR